MLSILDDFLDDFDSFNKHARSVDYGGEYNPLDGKLYPDISAHIPQEVLTEIKGKLADLFGRPVQVNTAFMRLTCDSTAGAPHQAHTDTVMGDYTFMYYLQDGSADCGTSLVEHKETGMRTNPVTREEFEAWTRDTNRPDAWEKWEMIPMKENRAAIFSSHLMHRAEPIGGFGGNKHDGRIALTIFFQ